MFVCKNVLVKMKNLTRLDLSGSVAPGKSACREGQEKARKPDDGQMQSCEPRRKNSVLEVFEGAICHS